MSNSTGTIVVEYRPADGETREVLTVEVRREEKIERIDLFLGERGGNGVVHPCVAISADRGVSSWRGEALRALKVNMLGDEKMIIDRPGGRSPPYFWQ